MEKIPLQRTGVLLPLLSLRNQSPCWLSKQNFMMVLRPYMPNFSVYSLIVARSATGGAEQGYSFISQMCCRSSWPPCFPDSTLVKGWVDRDRDSSSSTCRKPSLLQKDDRAAEAPMQCPQVRTPPYIPRLVLEGSHFWLPRKVCPLSDRHPRHPTQNPLPKASGDVGNGPKRSGSVMLAGGQITREVRCQLQPTFSIP